MDKKEKSAEVKKPIQFQIKGTETLPPIEGLSINPNNPTHHAPLKKQVAFF